MFFENKTFLMTTEDTGIAEMGFQRSMRKDSPSGYRGRCFWGLEGQNVRIARNARNARIARFSLQQRGAWNFYGRFWVRGGRYPREL